MGRKKNPKGIQKPKVKKRTFFMFASSSHLCFSTSIKGTEVKLHYGEKHHKEGKGFALKVPYYTVFQYIPGLRYIQNMSLIGWNTKHIAASHNPLCFSPVLLKIRRGDMLMWKRHDEWILHDRWPLKSSIFHPSVFFAVAQSVAVLSLTEVARMVFKIEVILDEVWLLLYEVMKFSWGKEAKHTINVWNVITSVSGCQVSTL